MRRWAMIAGVFLGVLLLLAAGGLRWVVAPAGAVLPADTDTTRIFSGRAAALLNASALSSPGSGPALLKDVPISIIHHTKVVSAKGDNALISDTASVETGGQQVGTVEYRYAVDRRSMALGSGYSGVVKQTGLTFNWPIRTQKKDYVGWVPDTQSTIPLRYKGEAKRGGIATLVFTTPKAKAALITDPKVLATLPASLPKATLAQLAGGLNLPAGQLGALKAVLPVLPDPVPFSYSYQLQATYWVAPATGIVIDVQQHEVRTLNLAVGATATPVTPVMDFMFTATDPSVVDAAKEATDQGKKITMAYTTGPLALAGVGVVLLLLGGIPLWRSRRHTEPTSEAVPGPTPTPQEKAGKV